MKRRLTFSHLVISPKNERTKLPISFTMILLLAMNVWHWSPLWRGVTYALLAVAWILSLLAFYHEEFADPFRRQPL